MAWLWALVVPFFAALVAVGTVAKDQFRAGWGIWLAAIAGFAIVAYDAGRSFLRNRKAKLVQEQISEYEEELHDKKAAETLTNVLMRVLASFPEANVRKIGLHAYWERQEHNATPVQDRVVRVRLSEDPSGSDTDWKKGVGVVGKCWDENDLVAYYPTEAEFDAYQKITYNDFHALDAAAKWDLDWKGWKQGRQYRLIVAVPINDIQGAYYGCVSLDVYKDRDTARCLWETEDAREKVTGALRGAAALLLLHYS